MRTALIGVAALALAAVHGAAAAQERYAYIGTSLFGENEPGGGDKDGAGDFTAELDLQDGKLCYLLELDAVVGVTAAHIHEGGKGKSGPPVVTLSTEDSGGDDICVDVDAELLRTIAKNLGKYYVNVHTEAFPEGAIRGQLDE